MSKKPRGDMYTADLEYLSHLVKENSPFQEEYAGAKAAAGINDRLEEKIKSGESVALKGLQRLSRALGAGVLTILNDQDTRRYEQSGRFLEIHLEDEVLQLPRDIRETIESHSEIFLANQNEYAFNYSPQELFMRLDQIKYPTNSGEEDTEASNLSALTDVLWHVKPSVLVNEALAKELKNVEHLLSELAGPQASNRNAVASLDQVLRNRQIDSQLERGLEEIAKLGFNILCGFVRTCVPDLEPDWEQSTDDELSWWNNYYVIPIFFLVEEQFEECYFTHHAILTATLNFRKEKHFNAGIELTKNNSDASREKFLKKIGPI